MRSLTQLAMVCSLLCGVFGGCPSILAALREGDRMKSRDQPVVVAMLEAGVSVAKLMAMEGLFSGDQSTSTLGNLVRQEKVELCNLGGPLQASENVAIRDGPGIRVVSISEGNIKDDMDALSSISAALAASGGKTRVAFVSSTHDGESTSRSRRQLASSSTDQVQYIKTTPQILVGVLLIAIMSLVVVLGVCCVSSIGSPGKFATVGLPPSKVH